MWKSFCGPKCGHFHEVEKQVVQFKQTQDGMECQFCGPSVNLNNEKSL